MKKEMGINILWRRMVLQITNKSLYKKGYITLETAIILPLFLSVTLTFASLLQIFLVYNCMKKSLDKVSYFFSAYAMLYHEKGCNAAENFISSELSDLLSNTVDVKTGLRYADDIMYQQVALQIFKFYLEKDEFYNYAYAKTSDVSLSGSTFFNGNDDIFLHVSAKIDIILPLYEKFLSGFIVNVSQKSRAWLQGDMTHFTVSDEDNESIWDLNNLDRGKKLREIFGGNLPEFFPVLSSYSNGVATMIKSMDHTAQTYSSPYEMKKELYEMADNLYGFKYTNYNSGNESIIIKEEDIKRKVILLIMPTNELTSVQQSVINEFINYCQEKNIKFDLRRYQKS